MSAKRVYYLGDNQISVDEADGSNAYLRDADAVSITLSGSQIVVSIGAAIYSLSPAEFLNSSGVAYGADAISAYTAFKSAKPASGGSSGGGTTLATFGTTAPGQTSITTNSVAVTTTNAIRIFAENTGSANATLTYGAVTYTMLPGDQREFVTYSDPTSGKLSPFLSMSVSAASTTVVVTKIFKQ